MKKDYNITLLIGNQDLPLSSEESLVLVSLLLLTVMRKFEYKKEVIHSIVSKLASIDPVTRDAITQLPLQDQFPELFEELNQYDNGCDPFESPK